MVIIIDIHNIQYFITKTGRGGDRPKYYLLKDITRGFWRRLLNSSVNFWGILGPSERELSLAGLTGTDSCQHTTQRRVVLKKFLFFSLRLLLQVYVFYSNNGGIILSIFWVFHLFLIPILSCSKLVLKTYIHSKMIPTMVICVKWGGRGWGAACSQTRFGKRKTF